MAERTCHICGTRCTEACPTCVANFEHRRHPDDMTPDERVEELELLRGTLEIPFEMVHQRVGELVGRPVYTHEMGFNWRGLVEEARTQDHPSLQEIVDLIPSGKRLILK